MDIKERLRLLAVRIEDAPNDSQRNSILGSGILWAPQEDSGYMYVFTAAHVVFGCRKLIIRYWNEDGDSNTINIDDESDIQLHEQNNYLAFENNRDILLENDVAVIRCKRKQISYINYKLKVVRNIKQDEELIFRGFPGKISNEEYSITLGREYKAKYIMEEKRKSYFIYELEGALKCEDRDEELMGLSGSGVFLNNEQLVLAGIHSNGGYNAYMKQVIGMNIELIRDICMKNNWDIPPLNKKSENTHTKPSIYKWEEINDDFLRNHSKYDDERLKGFLEGENCTWGLIVNNCTVKREATDKVVQMIESKKLIGILGPGGEGKSTILMQVCKKLNNKGYTIYWNTEQITRTLNDTELCSTVDSVVLVIDDASGNAEFEKFALQAINKGYRIIFTARENEWKIARTKSNNAKLDRELEIIELIDVTEEEAEKFSKLIIEQKMNNDKDESEIKKIFIKNNNGFLLAAMLMVVYGRPLEEIVKDVLLKIKKQSENILKVLAIICYFEDLETRINKSLNFTSELYRILYSSYEIKKKEISASLYKEVKKNNLNNMRTRHIEISKIIYDFLVRNDDAEFELSDLLYDFVMCFYKGQKTPQTDIITSIYPTMKEILCDIYINNIEISRQVISRNIADMYLNRPDIWLLWASKEISQGNIGQTVEEKFSARCILKEGSLKCSWDGNIYIKWAELEINEGNIGKHISEENSARWILQQGRTKCSLDENIYIKSAELEVKYGNIGQDINDKNSARWILKEGSQKCALYGNAYIKWAELEINQNNIGKDIYEENSARWILKEGTKTDPENCNTYIKWAELEIEEDNIGQNINVENSARWIFKEGSKRCRSHGNIYIKWAELEVLKNNIGEGISKENSAKWILNEGIRNCPLDRNIFLKLAELEVNFGNDEKAIEILIASLEFQDTHNLQLLALIQARNKNFSSEDPYSAKGCIDRLLKINESIHNLYTAYLCYRLYDSEEIAMKFKEKLSEEDIKRLSGENFFKFRRWEQGWIERSGMEQN